MEERYAYAYILANSFRKLYIGVTTDIVVRITQHKRRANPDCHTARYGIDELVYYERFTNVGAAIKREKVLKGWLRIRKLELIIGTNPHWKDLSVPRVKRWFRLILSERLSREPLRRRNREARGA